MCSSLVQIVFNVGLIAGLGLTIAALFTPSWVKEQNSIKQGEHGFFACAGEVRRCVHEVWTDLERWERVTFVCLAASIGFAVLALIWSTVLCCCLCCLKCCLLYALPPLVGFACLLDLIGVATYATHATDASNYSIEKFFSKPELGSCVWIGTAATIALFIDFILSFFLLRVSKASPI